MIYANVPTSSLSNPERDKMTGTCPACERNYTVTWRFGETSVSVEEVDIPL